LGNEHASGGGEEKQSTGVAFWSGSAELSVEGGNIVYSSERVLRNLSLRGSVVDEQKELQKCRRDSYTLVRHALRGRIGSSG